MIRPSPFFFRGRIPSSKSIYNRLLIIQSFEPKMQLRGDSNADDVLKMKTAIKDLFAGLPADCGAAGTTLRFLALRASRIRGTHLLTGSKRLFERPQTEIFRLLEQLGCEASIEQNAIKIKSNGWRYGSSEIRPVIKLDRSISSQFASALVLSAWDLPEPMVLSFEGDAVSEGYFQMTLELVRRFGMNWSRAKDGSIEIPAQAKIGSSSIQEPVGVESDLSSSFAVAALAAIAGRAELMEWPHSSLQPDRVFLEILREMGCKVRCEAGESGNTLIVEKPETKLLATDCNLKDSPDLFPVLSVLCGLAEGRSRLYGAPHLAHKESSRIEKSAEILKLIGARFTLLPDGIEIEGPAPTPVESSVENKIQVYDPDDDHRLAMAAAVAMRAGYPIQVTRPEVVNKSFPEFWSVF